ncbi:hypothetical protein WR25_07931 [Diploscapter pachys]|uniref:Uncharacterized protein n=1 Tax=Diploscapter pachys TaxID=2018661 RepID=A0A2A2KK83_9BILA|nr:hypothetical protein WR25_07931 [Diploscapter pachys]
MPSALATFLTVWDPPPPPRPRPRPPISLANFETIILKCPKIHLPYDETPTMSDDSRRVGEINRKLIGKLTGPIRAWIGADQIELIDSDLYSLLGCFSLSLFQPSNPFGNFVSSSIPED